MKKQNAFGKLVLSRTVVTKFNDTEQVKGGRTETCLNCHVTIRCGYTIGDETDDKGNPCTGTILTQAHRCGHTIGDGSDGNGNPCTI